MAATLTPEREDEVVPSSSNLQLNAEGRVLHLLDFMKQNAYLFMVAMYVILLLLTYIRFGVLFQFSLGMYALLVLPLVMILSKRRLSFIKSWVPFLTIILMYEALQGVVGAMVEAGEVVSLYAMDVALWGLNLTGAIQSALVSQPMTLAMTFFYTLHLPLVVFASVYLWHDDKGLFKRYVSAITVTSYLALVTFVFLPTAPPWYEGAAQNLLQSADSLFPVQAYQSVMSLIEADKFAALPSLHTAYAVIFLFYMKKRGRRSGLLALTITSGILFSTLYLGQHYAIDLIFGAVYALGSCFITDRMVRPRDHKEGLEIPQAETGGSNDRTLPVLNPIGGFFAGHTLSQIITSSLSSDMIISEGLVTCNTLGCVRTPPMVALRWERWGSNQGLGPSSHQGTAEKCSAALPVSSTGLYYGEAPSESLGKEWDSGG